MAEVDLQEARAAFPVVLYKGEQRINVGNVEIHPALDYKQFRVALNQMIGISYNNLTTYLIDNKRESIQQEEQRKILITGKVNFSGLVREKNCYFLAVLKRSRRDRRRRKSKKEIIGSNQLPPRPLNPFYLPVIPKFYEVWFYESQIQRANYVNSVLIVNSNYGFHWSRNINSRKMIESESRVQSCRNRDLCTDCMNADKQGAEPEFHLCVYDEVVVEGFFRSPAGPICRPRTDRKPGLFQSGKPVKKLHKRRGERTFEYLHARSSNLGKFKGGGIAVFRHSLEKKMEEGGSAAVFPVALFIWHHQIYCGNVEIRPALHFEQFLMVLNDMIRASYFHLTTYTIDNRRLQIPFQRRNILVSGKLTFFVLGQQKSFNFLVELPPAPQLVPGDVFLIYLNHLHIIDPEISTTRSGTHNYEGRFHDIHTQGSNNVNMLWNLNFTHMCFPFMNLEFSRIVREAEMAVWGRRSRERCKDCRVAEVRGIVAEFHHCVYDEIVHGFFRSPAGPIGPLKR
ncbi:hypothetical protein OSB04_009418 [Centaurea solstitialis]|uniref:DUF7138 domain-containing protein n=1 Tax=Centaurea solstitialis TaxID=347529 RepID=A0AA38T5L8_9ASTR|nr:hypothetical protein OSB04_009418 [Centaurea solstitialis]